MSGVHDSSEARTPQATRILIVEDSYANRDMLTRRLQRRGFAVSSAVDGATGVALSVSEQPDVILMDVAMGDMDGWQATRLVKADPRTTHIPVIALTAHALESDRDMSFKVGCADFDTKPVDLARLLEKIQRCLKTAADRQSLPIADATTARLERTPGVNSHVHA